jgi:cobalt-zinc-cadmium resistance protein CzcA
MLERILDFATRQRFLMVLLGVAIAALGLWSFTRLPIDAVPDITNNQVVVNTAAPALSPQEVDKQISVPIQTAMAGIPGVQEVRSLSNYGLSQITIIFDDDVDIYRARQMVTERITDAKDRLPQGTATPTLGPVATGLGEIFMYAVEATGPKADGKPYSLTDLRMIQEWEVRPQLRTVKGITEINTIGGYERQYEVTPDPMKMVARGFSFKDITDALSANNSNTGGGYIEHNGDQYLVRSIGLIANEEDIRNVKVGSRDGAPVLIRDIASVAIGHELRTGGGTLNGHEAVICTAIMLMGENSRAVAQRVNDKLRVIGRSMPVGVKLIPLYDRTFLVDATLHTVRENLFEGAILVAAILLLFLGNFRAAFIVALAIPLSMLFAAFGMVTGKISANLMSLGAIDFGIIIDGAVVMIENIMRRLSIKQHEAGRPLQADERIQTIREAAVEVRRPTLFGELIIAIVYLPILTLSSIEGKMFVPMAGVVLLALLGALILSFTLMPALAALLLRGKISETDNAIVRGAKSAYEPVLTSALNAPWAIVVVSVLLLAGAGRLAWSLGGEFIPKLKEGAIAIEGERVFSIGLTQSLAMEMKVEKTFLKEFPDEIQNIFSRTGTAEIATDPGLVNSSDIFIILKPREEWKKARTQDELSDKMKAVMGKLPGEGGNFKQPIELRFDDMISGIKEDVAVKVFGDDLDQIYFYGSQIKDVLKQIPGSKDIKLEPPDGLPVLDIDLDRKAIARLGLNVKDVQDTISTAMGGSVAGQIIEGDRFFDMVVRLPDKIRQNIESIRNIPIALPAGSAPEIELASAGSSVTGSTLPAFVPLSNVAKVSISEKPIQITRENGKLMLPVKCNVAGRDLTSFVAEAQQKVDAKVHLRDGYWYEWGGSFENYISAIDRLKIVVPLSLVLIFILLYGAFNSIKDALLVFTGVPLALTGGVLSLWLRGIPFSITAAVGFIALSGVAVLNGLVMLTFINQLRREGRAVRAAIIEGCLARLRPVLMTALVASLGFVPMALATGMGAEVQRPLATVVIGGVISSAALTLFVLPVLYWLVHQEPQMNTDEHRSN